MNETLLEATKAFVAQKLNDAEGGHDWFHTLRVYDNAMAIAQNEEVQIIVVQLASLLHDIADAKFHDGDESIGPNLAKKFLKSQNAEDSLIDQVVYIVQNMSFKNSLNGSVGSDNIEMAVVQDADMLDAIGAIGIARTFNYGGYKNRPLFDPDIPPILNLSKSAYKKSNAPTINHFYEKLLKLKGMMKTRTGRQMAEKRHQFMVQYLENFYEECGSMAVEWRQQWPAL